MKTLLTVSMLVGLTIAGIAAMAAPASAGRLIPLNGDIEGLNFEPQQSGQIVRAPKRLSTTKNSDANQSKSWLDAPLRQKRNLSRF